jgi:hypothetical protein
LGKVTEKNVNLIETRLKPGGLKAIKHANGRDWWVLIQDWNSATWFIFILDPDGLRLSHVDEAPEMDDFTCWLTLYDYASDQFICMTGDHFFPWIPATPDSVFEYDFHVFDFDRCSGTIARLNFPEPLICTPLVFTGSMN